MTDLGKERRLCGPLPLACHGFSEGRTLAAALEAPLLICSLSLSDEQEDESMETTGKVEPV